jgi:hypothetical protein
MNVLDILKYGDQTLMRSVKDLPESDWEVGGVCGVWSVKDIVAHLSSYELLLADVLRTFLDGGPTPNLDEMARLRGNFNDDMVARRRQMTMAEVVTEYGAAQAEVMGLAAQVPPETYRQNGTLPWYGLEYCLDDYVVYTNYAHKREHSAEINVYRDQLKRAGKLG